MLEVRCSEKSGFLALEIFLDLVLVSDVLSAVFHYRVVLYML